VYGSNFCRHQSLIWQIYYGKDSRTCRTIVWFIPKFK